MLDSSSTSISVLLSEALKNKIGSALENFAAKSQQQITLLTPEVAPSSSGTYPINLAFISRDVTGQSTKNDLKEPLLRFYDILRNSPDLKWVHAHSAGADRPIYPELMAKGVKVTTSSGANADAVAHTALGAILALGRQFKSLFESQQKRQWTPVLNNPHVHSFKNKKVMIIGWGPIGQELSKCLCAMDMNVLVVTRSPSKYQDSLSHIEMIGLEDLKSHVSGMDYLVLACPLTDQTHSLIDANIFSLMKPDSYLVNVSRGEVVDQLALIEALQKRKILGAFLDVFQVEPLDPDSVLWDLPNVIVSPHTAGHFSGHNSAVEQIFIHNFEKYIYGQVMLNEVSFGVNS